MSKESEKKELKLRVADPELVAKLSHGSTVPHEIWGPVIGGPTLERSYLKTLDPQPSDEQPRYLMFFGSAAQAMLYGPYLTRGKKAIAGRNITDLDIYGSTPEVSATFSENHHNTGRLAWASCKDYAPFRDQYCTTLAAMTPNGGELADKYFEKSQTAEDFWAATAMFKHETVSLIMTRTQKGELEVKLYDPFDFMGDLRRHMRLAKAFSWGEKLVTQGIPVKEQVDGVKSKILRAYASGAAVPVDMPLGYAMNITKVMHHTNLYGMSLPLESDLKDVYMSASRRLAVSTEPGAAQIQEMIDRNAAMDFLKAAMISPNEAIYFVLASLPLGTIFSTRIGEIFLPLYKLRSATYDVKINDYEHVFANTALSRILNILVARYHYQNTALQGTPEYERHFVYTPIESYSSINELFAIIAIGVGWDQEEYTAELQELISNWNSYGFDEFLTYGWRMKEKNVRITVDLQGIRREIVKIKEQYPEIIRPRLPTAVPSFANIHLPNYVR